MARANRKPATRIFPKSEIIKKFWGIAIVFSRTAVVAVALQIYPRKLWISLWAVAERLSQHPDA
ncbi:MAG: hypothetical protein FWC58_01965, partial [Desulfobulbus sp.]|nr:hypothetical protein [Desulfobulbus sp.]